MAQARSGDAAGQKLSISRKRKLPHPHPTFASWEWTETSHQRRKVYRLNIRALEASYALADLRFQRNEELTGRR